MKNTVQRYGLFFIMQNIMHKNVLLLKFFKVKPRPFIRFWLYYRF